jgi:CxxC motif-containing protein
MKKELLCIQCPVGCSIAVEMDENGRVQAISGQGCKLGEAYAADEAVNPKRTLTTILPVEGGTSPIAVRSSAPLPKDRVFDALCVLCALKAPRGVKAGDIIVSDVLGLGVDIVATRDDWN